LVQHSATVDSYTLMLLRYPHLRPRKKDRYDIESIYVSLFNVYHCFCVCY